MSELKAYIGPHPTDNTLTEYYLKSEADQVIAHNKYKRCLTMARWCDEVMLSCELRGYTVHRIWANKHKWAMRWKYRWLELAEKFKEGFVIGVDKVIGTDNTVVINHKEAKC